MSISGDLDSAAAEILAAARAGDGAAFEALVDPQLRPLHLHCYRMLGSPIDAEDALQETLLQAWRGLGGYSDQIPLAQWLYRITTATCLKMISRRARSPGPAGEVAWLQPYPDALLDEFIDPDADPAAAAGRRDSVAPDFIAALQSVPAADRAVLILRDVLCWAGRDVADVLDTTGSDVANALQRARAVVAQSPGGTAPPPPADREDRAVDAFVRAWTSGAAAAVAATLAEDAVLTVPAESVRVLGREPAATAVVTGFGGPQLEPVRLTVTRANGQPALAVYRADRELGYHGYGFAGLTVVDDAVTRITGFPDPDLFAVFGLPVCPR